MTDQRLARLARGLDNLEHALDEQASAPPRTASTYGGDLSAEDRARLLRRYGKEPRARWRAWRDAKVLARIVLTVLVVGAVVLLAGCSTAVGLATQLSPTIPPCGPRQALDGGEPAAADGRKDAGSKPAG